MKILALEFSSPQRAAAIVDAKPGAPPACLGESIETGQATNALGLIEQSLRQAQLDRGQIEAVAVGLGPGSYHGIRLAIALAQGWSLARPVKVFGLSSAECIAAEAHGLGIRGTLQVVIDAQRNEIYAATYHLGEQAACATDELRLLTLAEAQSRVSAGGLVAGPEAQRWFPGSRVIFPRAATLGQLASRRTDPLDAADLQPIYLRPTQFVKAPPPRFRG